MVLLYGLYSSMERYRTKLILYVPFVTLAAHKGKKWKMKNKKKRRKDSFLTISCINGCLQNIDDVRNFRRTKVPIFDLENGTRSGFKELEVSEDCGVVY